MSTSKPDSKTVPLRSVHTSNLPDILAQLNISLVVSTYQAGKVILVRAQSGEINTHFRDFQKPMGIAVDGQRLTIGGQNTVWYLRNMPALAAKLEPHHTHDACYLPRAIHVTGDIDIHELAWGKDDLWIVNTRFCCLCTVDPDHSFAPRWRPHFVTELAPQDRCHLNGVAMVGGVPKYVTALGETDTPGGWRANKRDGGILMDVEKNEVLVRGLSMPHSPRVYAGRLWFLESGIGGLGWIDLPNETRQTVAQLPGFTRGLDFVGNYAFIGLSQVRETATFSGIPLVETLEERTCGVWVVDIRNGETVGFLRFESGVQEIFAVQAISARFPEMLPWGHELIKTSYVLPDEAMRDVPEALAQASPIPQPPNENDPFVAAVNQGAALLDEDRVKAALKLFRKAREINPNSAEVYNHFGNAYTAQNKLGKAVTQYKKAIKLNPNLADAHMNLGMALLKLGELAEGFREFDWRWQTRLFTPFIPPQPRWDGSPMPDKTLLVHTEQGAGDTIQFTRYLPLVSERVGKVLLVAPAPLQALLATAEGVDEIRGAGDIPAIAFDAYIPVMTLGNVFQTTLETIPSSIPYLQPPHAWTGPGVFELSQKPGFSKEPKDSGTLMEETRFLKVGIAWAGSPTQGNDRNRSTTLATFEPLFDLPGIAWYSLQVGEQASELHTHEGGLPLTDLSPHLESWGDTAAAIRELDLVISVDTAVVHLAGALGKPAWVLLCHAPDWRWMLERNDSPWYRQVRLFRQPKPKDWASVVAEVSAALSSFAVRQC